MRILSALHIPEYLRKLKKTNRQENKNNEWEGKKNFCSFNNTVKFKVKKIANSSGTYEREFLPDDCPPSVVQNLIMIVCHSFDVI